MPNDTTSRRAFFKHTTVAAVTVAALGVCEKVEHPMQLPGEAAKGAVTALVVK